MFTLSKAPGKDLKWVWVKLKPGIGPQILVHVSIYLLGQAILGFPYFDSQPNPCHPRLREPGVAGPIHRVRGEDLQRSEALLRHAEEPAALP